MYPDARCPPKRLRQGNCEHIPRRNRRSCRGGVKKGRRAREQGRFQVTFANITAASAKAKHWAKFSESDLVFLAETHLLRDELPRFAGEFAEKWRLHASPASPSELAIVGSNGGAACLARKCIRALPLETAEPDGHIWISPVQDLVGVQVSLGKIEALVFGGYNRGGPCEHIFQAIFAATLGGKLPFIYLADMNCDPGAADLGSWARALAAKIVVAGKGEPTLRAGKGKTDTTIDMMIVSECLYPLVLSFWIDWEVPFSPHAALHVVLARRAELQVARVLASPAALPEPALGDQEPACDNSLWEEAAVSANKFVEPRLPLLDKCLGRELAQQIGAADASRELGAEYWKWCRTFETWTLLKARIDPEDRSSRRFFGRGAPPRFVMKCPIPSRGRLPVKSQISGRGPAAYNKPALVADTALATIASFDAAKPRRTGVIANALLAIAAAEPKSLGFPGFGEDAAAFLIDTALLLECGRLALALLFGSTGEIEAAIPVATASAEATLAFHRKAARAQAASDFRAFVLEALDPKKGARGAHRYTNLPNTSVAFVDNRLSLQQRADGDADTWGKIWKETDKENCRTAAQSLKVMRQDALQAKAASNAAAAGSSDQSLWSPPALRKLSKQFSGSTGLGTDSVPFAAVEGCCDAGLLQLGRLIDGITGKIAWPVQVLLSLMCSIPKKTPGDTRTIVLLASLVRLVLSALSPEVRAWDARIAVPGDTALKGVVAYHVSALRLALAASQVKLGKVYAQILIDITKFFDTVDPPTLQNEARELAAPPVPGALAAWLHRSPRILRKNKVISRPVLQTGVSILAGSTTATSEARAIVTRPLRQTQPLLPQGDIGVHVDDISLGLAAENSAELRNAIVPACARLAASLVERGHQISGKTTVVASNPGLAIRIANDLRGHGFRFAAAQTAEHLGVAATGAARRDQRPLLLRMRKARKRAKRINQLAAVSTAACGLYKTGAKPMQSYSASIVGPSPAVTAEALKNAVLCAGKLGVQPCKRCLLEIRLGKGQDPREALQVETLELWIAVWAKASPQEKRLLTKGWRASRVKLEALDPARRWKIAVDPVDGAICVLLQNGWLPLLPSRWLTPGKEFAANLDLHPGAGREILEFFRAGVSKKIWADAANHIGGTGLQTGVPWTEPALKVIRDFRKKGNTLLAAALEAAVAGGTWAATRFAKRRERGCKHCGACDDEDLLHRYWACPQISRIPDPDGAIADTQQFCQQALSKEGVLTQCFWTRALVPSSWMPAPPSAEKSGLCTAQACTSNWNAALRKSNGAAYTDGSGGPNSIDAVARCVGAGAAVVVFENPEEPLKAELLDVALAAVKVAGKQTVPRAELSAVGLASSVSTTGLLKRNGIDATYALKALSTDGGVGESKALRYAAGGNGDLVRPISAELSRHPDLELHKVKGHATFLDVLRKRVSLQDWFGNIAADTAADVSAVASQKPPAERQAAAATRKLATAVAKRIATIESYHWETRPVLVEEPELAAPQALLSDDFLQQAALKELSASGHALRRRGAWVVCSKCPKRARPGNAEAWLGSVCGLFPASGKRKFVDFYAGEFEAASLAAENHGSTNTTEDDDLQRSALWRSEPLGRPLPVPLLALAPAPGELSPSLRRCGEFTQSSQDAAAENKGVGGRGLLEWPDLGLIADLFWHWWSNACLERAARANGLCSPAFPRVALGLGPSPRQLELHREPTPHRSWSPPCPVGVGALPAEGGAGSEASSDEDHRFDRGLAALRLIREADAERNAAVLQDCFWHWWTNASLEKLVSAAAAAPGSAPPLAFPNRALGRPQARFEGETLRKGGFDDPEGFTEEELDCDASLPDAFPEPLQLGTALASSAPEQPPPPAQKLVSRTQRAKLIRQNRVFAKQRRETNLQTLDSLWDRVERAACSSSGSSRGNADWGILPTFLSDAHPTHKLLTCGGFLACRWCGRLASVAAGNLQQVCRRRIPQGGREPLLSLLRGSLPRHWSTWPDGGEGVRRPWVVKTPGCSGRPCAG